MAVFHFAPAVFVVQNTVRVHQPLDLLADQTRASNFELLNSLTSLFHLHRAFDFAGLDLLAQSPWR